MKTNVLAIILSGAVATLAIGDAMAQTQNSRSTYFLEGSTYRHELNPAFMGERGYVSFPGLGNLTIGAQSTGGVGDFIFKKANGDLTTFYERGSEQRRIPERIAQKAESRCQRRRIDSFLRLPRLGRF